MKMDKEDWLRLLDKVIDNGLAYITALTGAYATYKLWSKEKSENLDLASLSNRLWDKGSDISPQSLLYHERE